MAKSIICGRVVSLLLAVFITSGCTSLLYFPRISKRQLLDPQKYNLKEENINIIGDDGRVINAWWFSASGPSKGTIVFFHGNAENLTSHFASISWLPAEGYNYLVWDYPGYGFSDGEPSPEDNVRAGCAVLKWVAKNRESRPLIIYGQSLGGNIALKTALESKNEISIKAMVIDASFLSYRSIARKKASESWLLWLFQPLVWLSMSDSYAPKNIERLSPIPLLVIHGQKDRVVNPEFGDEIYDLAAEPKQIWRIPEGVHNDTFWSHGRTYRKKLVEYLGALR